MVTCSPRPVRNPATPRSVSGGNRNSSNPFDNRCSGIIATCAFKSDDFTADYADNADQDTNNEVLASTGTATPSLQHSETPSGRGLLVIRAIRDSSTVSPPRAG